MTGHLKPEPAWSAYDRQLLDKARQLAALNTWDDRQRWLREHSEPGTRSESVV